MEENYGYILKEHTGKPGDGGVDLIMIDSYGKLIAVQCKYSCTKPVGKKALNEIFTGKALKYVDYGMLCTNNAFSIQCQNEALQLGIKLERIAFS